MHSISISLAFELVVQLAALGVLLGMTAACVAKPRQEKLADILGTHQRRLDARWLAPLCGSAGAATALVHISVALARGWPVSGLPGAPLLIGALAGLSGCGVTTLARPAKQPPPPERRRRRLSSRRRQRKEPVVPEPGGRRAELMMATVTTAIVIGLFAAASAAPTATIAVAAGGLIGAVTAQSWVLIRIPTRTAVRGIQKTALRPAPPGIGVMAVTGAVGGALVTGAVLTAGVRAPAPLYSAVAAGGALALLAILWLPLSSYVRLPQITVERFPVAGHETVVLRAAARDEREGRAPVFCVNGWSGDAAEPWPAAFKALQRESARELIAIALPELSTGSSSLDGRQKLPQLVDFLRAAIEQLSPGEPVLLVGTSLGGLVTLALAQDETSPIVGWVTVGSMGFDIPALLRLVTYRVVAAPFGGLGVLLPAWARRPFVRPLRTHFTPEVSEEAIEELHMEIGDEAEVRRILGHGPRFLNEANKSIDPRRIRFHGLAVWGTTDRLSPPRNAAWLRRRRPDLEVVVLEGPHSLHTKQPEVFARTLVSSRVYAFTERTATDYREVQTQYARAA